MKLFYLLIITKKLIKYKKALNIVLSKIVVNKVHLSQKHLFLLHILFFFQLHALSRTQQGRQNS